MAVILVGKDLCVYTVRPYNTYWSTFAGVSVQVKIISSNMYQAAEHAISSLMWQGEISSFYKYVEANQEALAWLCYFIQICL